MFFQFDAHGGKIVDRVQSQEVTICATNEYMFFKTVVLFISYRNRTSNLFIFEGLNCILFFQGIKIKNFYLFVGSIYKQKLLLSILNVKLRYHKTDMLRHLMDKLHLNLASYFITFVSHYKLCNLLVTHIRGPIYFSSQFFDVTDTILIRKLKSWFKQCQISTNVLKYSKTWLVRISVS